MPSSGATYWWGGVESGQAGPAGLGGACRESPVGIKNGPGCMAAPLLPGDGWCGLLLTLGLAALCAPPPTYYPASDAMKAAAQASWLRLKPCPPDGPPLQPASQSPPFSLPFPVSDTVKHNYLKTSEMA